MPSSLRSAGARRSAPAALLARHPHRPHQHPARLLASPASPIPVAPVTSFRRPRAGGRRGTAIADSLRIALFERARRSAISRPASSSSRTARGPRAAEPARRAPALGTGIGLLTATTLTGFVGDLRRFPSARRFASYLGLTQRERSSARSEVRRDQQTRRPLPPQDPDPLNPRRAGRRTADEAARSCPDLGDRARRRSGTRRPRSLSPASSPVTTGRRQPRSRFRPEADVRLKKAPRREDNSAHLETASRQRR